MRILCWHLIIQKFCLSRMTKNSPFFLWLDVLVYREIESNHFLSNSVNTSMKKISNPQYNGMCKQNTFKKRLLISPERFLKKISSQLSSTNKHRIRRMKDKFHIPTIIQWFSCKISMRQIRRNNSHLLFLKHSSIII